MNGIEIFLTVVLGVFLVIAFLLACDLIRPGHILWIKRGTPRYTLNASDTDDWWRK